MKTHAIPAVIAFSAFCLFAATSLNDAHAEATSLRDAILKPSEQYPGGFDIITQGKKGEKLFEFVRKGYPEEQQILYRRHGGCTGNGGVIYDIKETEGLGNASGMDKAMHSISPAIKIGEKRYSRFNILVPGTFATDMLRITNAPLVWQLWQGSPYPPPVYAKLFAAPESRTVTMAFFVKNDKTTPSTKDGINIGQIEFPKGVCQEIVIAVIPRHYGPNLDESVPRGTVRVFTKDGDAYTMHFHWKGFIGYDPDNPYGWFGDRVGRYHLAKAQNSFRISAGLYRRRQELEQKVIFSDWDFGTTFRSVSDDSPVNLYDDGRGNK